MPFLGKKPTEVASPVDINSGSIDGTTIGGGSAAPATVTTFTSTGIDDNADATAITISSAEKVGINNASPSELLSMIGTGGTAKVRFDGDSSNLQNNFIGITGYDDLIIASDEANSGSASTIQFRVDAAEKMRILSGGGITFNGDTATANALGDYEEGTWTPTITGYSGGSTQAYSNQTGIYRKVGNLVYVSYRITLTSKGNMSGNYVLLQGLPYSIGGTAVTAGAGGIGHFSGLNQAVTSLFWELGAGTTNSFWLIYITGTSAYGSSYMPVSGLGNSFYMTGSAVYYT